MNSEQMHSVRITYPDIDSPRAMTWHSVASMESLELRDFREFFPADIAKAELMIAGRALTSKTLELRQEKLADTMPIQNIDKITSFIRALGIQPRGAISLSNEVVIDGERITSLGVTSSVYGQAFVVSSNAVLTDEHNKELVEPIGSELLLDQAAVHELVHLAGLSDVGYFLYDEKNWRHVKHFFIPGPVLTNPRNPDRAGYLEEGFAALCGFMYIWRQRPELMDDQRSVPRLLPDGTYINLPVRYSVLKNNQAYMAWSIERLIDLVPSLWGILVDSRTYGRTHRECRSAVQAELDTFRPWIFEKMENIDMNDRQQVVTLSSRIDHVVRKLSSRS